MDYIRAIERQQIREDIPQVRVADNVKVHYRIKEGDRERIQVFPICLNIRYCTPK